MADSSVPITAGSGTNIDTRTESVNGDHRQVVVLGDPSTGANVVTVLASGRALVVNQCATGTSSSVAGAAADTQLLASTATRLGATLFNESTSVCYLALGFVSSTTAYSYQLPPYGYFEVPFGFTGIIKGYWATATGNMRITEFT